MVSRKTTLIVVLVGGAAAAAVGLGVAAARSTPSVSIQASATAISPGASVSFTGNATGYPTGQVVTLYINGVAAGTYTLGSNPNLNPGYYVITASFPTAGTFQVQAKVGTSASQVITVTVTPGQANTYVIAAVTASGTCDIPFTGTATDACTAAANLIGQYEDSIFGGCYHEIVTSDQVYLGASLICSHSSSIVSTGLVSYVTSRSSPRHAYD